MNCTEEDIKLRELLNRREGANALMEIFGENLYPKSLENPSEAIFEAAKMYREIINVQLKSIDDSKVNKPLDPLFFINPHTHRLPPNEMFRRQVEVLEKIDPEKGAKARAKYEEVVKNGWPEDEAKS